MSDQPPTLPIVPHLKHRHSSGITCSPVGLSERHVRLVCILVAILVAANMGCLNTDSRMLSPKWEDLSNDLREKDQRCTVGGTFVFGQVYLRRSFRARYCRVPGKGFGETFGTNQIWRFRLSRVQWRYGDQRRDLTVCMTRDFKSAEDIAPFFTESCKFLRLN